ncbi:MAG: hypothetical protein ABSD78_19415 [Acidimicrobiales bacterium]
MRVAIIHLVAGAALIGLAIGSAIKAANVTRDPLSDISDTWARLLTMGGGKASWVLHCGSSTED